MKLILVLLLILAMCFGVMHSCDLPLSLSSYRYENADRYTAGSGSLYAWDEIVRQLDIDWISGNVTVQYHDEDYIAVSETTSRTLDKDNLLHYWLDGDTLRIRFAKSGRFPSASLRDKELTVLLPRDTVLRDLSVETVSADIFLRDITADGFHLESVSGDMELPDVYFANELSAESVSGAGHRNAVRQRGAFRPRIICRKQNTGEEPAGSSPVSYWNITVSPARRTDREPQYQQ